MTSPSLWYYAINSFFIIPIAFSALYILFNLYLSPLSKIPGPFSGRVSKWWLIRHARRGDPHREIVRVHERYGIWFVWAHVKSLQTMQPPSKLFIRDEGAGSKFRKSEFYGVWQGHRKFDLFAEQNEKVHASHRKLISRMYSLDSLKNMEQYINGTLSMFLKQMQERQGRSLDLGLWLQLFAFDVIGEVTFSKPFGFLNEGIDDGSFRQIEEVALSASWIGQVPWLYWLHDLLQPIIGNHLALNNRHGRIREFATREIHARQDRGSDRPDILSKLFEVQTMKPDEMNREAVTSMVSSNIFAGSDTTAASLRAIFYYLLKTPACKQKLLDEIDGLKKTESVGSIVSYKQSQQMPYLQACIHEALRLFPVAGLALPRVVPPGGIDIAGCFIPEGYTVGVNAWALHYNKAIFGDDAEVFRPERWLSKDASEMERCFFSWGAGSRTCIGKSQRKATFKMNQLLIASADLAMVEISKLIPTFFMHFDIQLTDPNKEWIETCRWFMKQEGLHVVLQPKVL